MKVLKTKLTRIHTIANKKNISFIYEKNINKN